MVDIKIPSWIRDEVGKPTAQRVRTRSGHVVRIYALVDGYFSIHGAVGGKALDEPNWSVAQWRAGGQSSCGTMVHEFDLIEVRPKRPCECWVVFYPGNSIVAYSFANSAHNAVSHCPGSILIHVKREEEEGHRDE